MYPANIQISLTLASKAFHAQVFDRYFYVALKYNTNEVF
jgi:ABC-type uncharacterized transport system substrate-binding protein